MRITEGAFDRVRALALGEEPAPELTEEQVVELELAGLLVDSPDDEDALVLDQHWEEPLRAGCARRSAPSSSASTGTAAGPPRRGSPDGSCW
ncbi:hypothetical protein [Brachybacterium sp. GPGPB12]|uniref:hypothetical protein n=1 Tax=Brachybacterium sp. GPGPB12 TaxID=3023517 RepID=UPI003134376F